jgi:hypothetical protein
LAKDDFFRDLISEGQEGYVDVAAFLKCNKVKKMNATTEMIAEAVASSEQLELNEDKTQLRRKGNKALPEKTGSLKKREQKQEAKTQAKEEET